MGVLEVNVGTASVPDWRKIGCGGTVTPPDWLAYKAYTVPTAAGLRSITFDSPITLVPGVDYWYVLQDLATDAHAQGTSDPNLTFTNISVMPGHYYSFSGGGFGSSSTTRYPIFGMTASSGTAPELGFGVAPSDYWGPSTIAQPFQVTSTVTLTGLTQYWGGNAGLTGKWGIARSITAPTGRLKLWDGTRWVREVCDDDTGPTFTDDFNRANTSNDTTNWQTGYAGTPTDNTLTKVGITSNQLYCSQRDAGIHSYAWLKAVSSADIDVSVVLAADSGVFGNNGKNGLAFRINPADGSFFFLTFNTLWWCDSAGNLTIVYNFGSLYGVGFAQGDVQRILAVGDTIRLFQNGTEVGPGFTSSNNETTGVRHGVELGLGAVGGQRWDDFSVTIPLERHPLKMWDGTAWQAVACLTPA